MAKIVDITDKLSFDGNPKLVIKGKELEVNAEMMIQECRKSWMPMT